MTRNYKSELEEARRELTNMLMDAEAFQTRIAKQKRKVAALTELADVTEDSAAPLGLVEGITDAVRTVFRSAEKPLSPAEVRTRVEALGLPAQKNILASVHTVIRRLRESGEIEPVGDVEFGGGYRWIRPTFGQRIAAQGQPREFVQKLGLNRLPGQERDGKK
jgi:hypothetical protein